MISGFTVQQQPEIGDLYAQEGKPERELYHQQDEDDGPEAYTESLSAALPHQSNFGCLCSSADNLTNHHYGNPFHNPPGHTQWCSAQNLAKTGSGIKRRLPSSASGAARASATTTNANVCTGIPVRQPDEPKTKKQLPLDQEDLDLTLRGFTKITLPTNFSSPRFHNSAPGGSSHCSSHFPERMVPVSSNPPTPSPVKGSPLTAQQYGFSPSAPVPPLPPLPALRRTTSDPTPASVYNVEESLNSQVRSLFFGVFSASLCSFFCTEFLYLHESLFIQRWISAS